MNEKMEAAIELYIALDKHRGNLYQRKALDDFAEFLEGALGDDFDPEDITEDESRVYLGHLYAEGMDRVELISVMRELEGFLEFVRTKDRGGVNEEGSDTGA